MLLLVLLLAALSALLYHSFFTLFLVCFLLYSCKAPTTQIHQQSYCINHRLAEHHPEPEQEHLQQVVISPSEQRDSDTIMSTHSSRAILVLALALTLLSQPVEMLEQDAQLLTPVASVVKSLINMATMGSLTPIDFNSAEVGRGLVSFVFRTGFPLTVPRTFLNNTQALFNRLVNRVYEADVRDVGRKTLASLKTDMDAIVDSVVEQVRQSPDGLYTNYLDTLVFGRVPLEEALTQLGLQLKAHGVDLKNYRDFAAMILGMPMVPELGAAASGVASLTPASINALKDVTSKLLQSGVEVQGLALNAITSPVQSYETFRQLSPLPLPSSSWPLSLFQSTSPNSQPVG